MSLSRANPKIFIYTAFRDNGAPVPAAPDQEALRLATEEARRLAQEEESAAEYRRDHATKIKLETAARERERQRQWATEQRRLEAERRETAERRRKSAEEKRRRAEEEDKERRAAAARRAIDECRAADERQAPAWRDVGGGAWELYVRCSAVREYECTLWRELKAADRNRTVPRQLWRTPKEAQLAGLEQRYVEIGRAYWAAAPPELHDRIAVARVSCTPT